MLLKDFWKFFSSLRLTVVCLILALILVFVGTLAQVHEGLYQAQARYFKSFLVWWSPAGAGWKIPVFPGGYSIGAVLLVNLIAGHIRRFGFTRQKVGIILIHTGLILLLVGQLLTDLLSVESSMRLTEGSALNYSEDFHTSELVMIEQSQTNQDRVFATPERLLQRQQEFPMPQTPLTLRIRQYWPNSELFDRPASNAVPVGATHGIGSRLHIVGKPITTRMDERNLPAALIEVASPEASLGTWLVASQLSPAQTFTHQGKNYEVRMRFTRYYKPFSLFLVDFRHDKYPGTEIPKNFSSRVRIQNSASGEDREVLIYMNNPLRYQGETFYQGSYDPNDPRVSILQVVRNPSWLTPYLSCALVGIGLTLQFMTHLLGFVKRRKA